MKPFLVLGGAGYIGSHMVRFLRERGLPVVVFDNLSTGHAFLCGDAPLVTVDICDPVALRAAFDQYGPFAAVLHFCARSLVAESVREPALYRRINVGGAENLLAVMRATGHRQLVFSSSAAVYGLPQTARLAESHPLRPVNPYGETKLAVEQLLRRAAQADGISSVSLRYFNAAGAHPDGSIGELHEPETHLIPNLLRALVAGTELNIYGQDYPTRDGTCIRDYIHVTDLCRAHLLALDHLARTEASFTAVNLGTGSGYSVREVIAASAEVTGRQARLRESARRTGDPAVLVASNEMAGRLLGWQPQITDIREIIASAWRWHQAPKY